MADKNSELLHERFAILRSLRLRSTPFEDHFI
jgi:hypothetical protein